MPANPTTSAARTHELKTVPPYFADVYHGQKTAELRKMDRPFQVGDHLLLREFFPEEQRYGSSHVRAEITHIVHDCDGAWLTRDYCMLSFKVLELKA